MGNQVIEKGLFTFLFPFQFLKKDHARLLKALEEDGFTNRFIKNSKTNRDETLQQYFYPFIEEKLFGKEYSAIHLNHFKKRFKTTGEFRKHEKVCPFILDELEVIVCPFMIGFIKVTIQIERMTLAHSIDFIATFRELTKQLPEKVVLVYESRTVENSEDMILNLCIPSIKPFMYEQVHTGYYGSLPYFEDERMFTLLYLEVENTEAFTDTDFYRILQLDGTDHDGQPKNSSKNTAYMESYLKTHRYPRWETDVYLFFTLQVMSVVAKQKEMHVQAVHHVQTTLFYNLLWHYFYRVVLLKFTYEHSEIKWANDPVIAESLIEKITLFSSKYFFKQVAVHSSGRAIAKIIRQQLRVDELYEEVKQSVSDLYRVVEDTNNNRYNQLLFVLTVFTVISGIFGMNLVIESWDQPIQFSALKTMSFFEVIAFFTGLIGIWISILLAVGAIIRKVMQVVRKKKYER